MHIKIAVVQAEWPTVLHRIDQGEPLRKVAEDYDVSYEAVRRVVHAARSLKEGQGAPKKTGTL